MKKQLATIITICSLGLLAANASAATRPPRVLKFSGVPLSQGNAIKKKFPFVFEREVTLAEVDEIVRWLMASGNFSNIEVVDREVPGGSQQRELVLVASLLRRVREIRIQGNSSLSNTDVLRILDVKKGEPFERKHLLASADELRQTYEQEGFHNANVEIDFQLPSDSEVDISVAIQEGKPLRITEALVETANPDLARRLSQMARSLKGQIFTENELSDFQKNVTTYLQENRYLTARVSAPVVSYNPDRTQSKIVYSVENPYRFDFDFDGNSYFSDSTIISQLELDRLSGAVSSPAPDLADKIRRLYQNAGFANMEVDFKQTADEKAFKQLLDFKIKEGARVRIHRVEISGNISRPEYYYSHFITSSGSELTKSGYYNRRDIEEGGKRLVTELQNQGFLRARIQSQRSEFSATKSSVAIFITIDEGPLTQVRQIKLEGAESVPRAQLYELMKIKAGAALSLKDLEDSIQALKDFYRSEGFLEMKIINENEQDRIVTYNDANTQANIEFQIYEGPRVVVSSVALQGNSFTKDEVILRELSFKTGDPLTPEKIEESIFHLQRLGLFTRVALRTLEEGTNIGERTVIVEVSERDPGLFTMGFGVNNDRQLTFRGYLGVAYRNIMGTGRALSFRIDPSYSTDPRISYLEHRVASSYLEPYIFGDHNRGRINVTRELRFSNFENDKAIIQEENSIGLLVERDLTRHLKLTFTAYNFSNQRKFERASLDTVETQNIAKTGPLLELDYRDDVFNPSRGSYSFINAEYSDPVLGSSEDEKQTIQFVKTNASHTQYVRLFAQPDFVFATSLRGGYLANTSFKGNSGVPSQEAFFLGGRSTIRGYDATSDLERIPNIRELGVAKLRDFSVKSDSYYYLLKTEVRFPLYKKWSLGGVIFYDGGAVLISQPDVHIGDPYRHSIGLGLRLNTPVGPVNLEYGFKLSRREVSDGVLESPGAFHFSIGTF